MYNLIKITGLILLLICFQNTEAQIFKKLKDKVEKKIERKVEQKIDQKVDKTVDNTIAGIFEDNKNTSPISEDSETSKPSDTMKTNHIPAQLVLTIPKLRDCKYQHIRQPKDRAHKQGL